MIGLFPVSLAPGIRVLATSRGLRAQVGPRGTSFGAVPFTYYQPLSGGRRHGGSYYAGPTQQQIAETSDEHQVVVIDEALHAIANIHRTMPAPVTVSPDAEQVPRYPELLAAYKRQELTGVRWSDRAGRKAAKARARELADAYAVHLQTRLSVDLATEADQIHHRWTLLRENQPQVVLETLGAAFEEHEAPASAVGVDEAEVLLLVLVPASSVVPTLEPSNGATGDRSLRPMSAETTAAWYREVVAGHVLVSVKDAFLVGSGLQSARVVAVRDEGADEYGDRRALPVLATRLTRSALAGVHWEVAAAWDIVGQCSDELLVNSSTTTGAMRPLDLTEQAGLAELVRIVDFV